MQTTTMQEIQRALGSPDVRLEEVAADTGLSYSTVARYARGGVSEPPHSVVQKLTAWLEARGLLPLPPAA